MNIRPNNFLYAVASAYVDNICKEGDELSRYTFVFPNRRSSRFFIKYIGELYSNKFDKPLFAPKTITVSDLFCELSGLKIVDPLEGLYELYKIYKTNEHKNESFDEFYSFGSLIISDFNDIDTYLADASQLFTNISDLQQIDSDYSYLSEEQRAAIRSFWRVYLDGNQNSSRGSFNSIWNIMSTLYTKFNMVLSKVGKGYSGHIYREVAEKIVSMGFDEAVGVSDFGTLVFIGFNAPNKCEQILMTYAQKADRADFYWDFYGEMITDRQNKASCFISSFISEFKSKFNIDEMVKADAEDQIFNVIGVPSGIGQAYAVNHILTELTESEFGKNVEVEKKTFDNFAFSTAVVLPDENLLMPVINAVPASFNKINVTMGYPLKITQLFSFMKSVFDLQKGIKNGRFYHVNVENIFSHYYIKRIDKEFSDNALKLILEHNYVYVDSDKIYSMDSCPELIKTIFRIPDGSMADIGAYLIDILIGLESYVEDEHREFIYNYYALINKVLSLKIDLSPNLFYKILYTHSSSITIPFKGEPLSGLQIMGPLETRSLDFENVIILSCNDGVFPSASMPKSLIPYNLRYGFGLPTYEMADTISAYHFYRNIYRAKNIYLLYDTRSGGVSNSEVSRYIMQLKYHYNKDMHEKVFLPMIASKGENPDQTLIIKTPEIMKELTSVFNERNPLSASTLNVYLQCPLRFYSNCVCGNKENNSVAEELESARFGNAFHKVMRLLYKPYEEKSIDAALLEKIANDDKLIDTLVTEAILSELKISDITGQNIIYREVLKKFIKKTLKTDKESAPFTYIRGEYRIEDYVHTDLIAAGGRVKLVAYLDRVDIKGDTLAISDYKTGTTNITSNVEVSDLFARDNGGKNRHLFQLYMYSLMFSHICSKYDISKYKYAVRLYAIKSIYSRSPYSISVDADSLYEYENQLHLLIDEIFNKDVPFYANPNEKVCSYCSLTNLCNKKKQI